MVESVWQRFVTPTQYIEPFCGSAAVLLGAPKPASLEVVWDASGFIANFWRPVRYQPAEVVRWADVPVSHIDIGAAHVWLMAQRGRLGAELRDIEWPGDAKVAGRWLHGQCAWIGSGFCEWTAPDWVAAADGLGKIPHVSDAGMGCDTLWTSAGRTAWVWLHKLAARLERVRVIHGDWTRCLNHHYGGTDTAVFLDPPYRAYDRLYGAEVPVADAVETWARDNATLRIALCGHRGDYDLPGWDAVEWSRSGSTYGSTKTKDEECV